MEPIVTVELPLSQANYVINLLADRPFREVAEIIPRLVQQIQSAVREAPTPQTAPYP